MLSHLPLRKSVEFRGVDWAAEAEKSQEGWESRKKARQRRRRVQRKRQHKMSDSELRSFLSFVVSDDENAPQALSMEACGVLLRRVTRKGFTTFPDGGTNVDKVQQLLEMFDTLKNDPELRPLIQSWMHGAVAEGFYSPQPEPSSPTSGGRGSTVSGLSDGTFETLSLSSENIADDVAAKIIESAVFAAYGVGMNRNLTDKKLWKDLSKIFRIDQFEYYDAMVKAKTKTEWPALDDGGENASLDSGSSKTFNDELAAAYKAFTDEANKANLSEAQIRSLNKYCFVHLQPDQHSGNST